MKSFRPSLVDERHITSQRYSIFNRSCPLRKRLKCFSIIKQAGAPAIDTPIPIYPFANSISTITEPNASIPQLFRRDLYFS